GNLIHAIHLCFTAPENAMGEVYNITNGEPVKFWNFVEEALKMAGLPMNRKYLPYLPVMAAAQMNEFLCRLLQKKEEPAFLPISIGVISFSMTMDISKARQKLGYAPKFTTLDGIREYFSN